MGVGGGAGRCCLAPMNALNSDSVGRPPCRSEPVCGASAQRELLDQQRVAFGCRHLGQVRAVLHDAPHAALIETDIFAKAQRLLRQRGEDATTRRSNTTEFLLSGLVVCAACGRRYVGTAAHDRNTRYRYYTFFSRNRHGRQGCRSDVLRADLLDQAALESLLATSTARLVSAKLC